MQQRILRYLPAGAAALTFIVYLFTQAPGVQIIDAGELAAVQGTLGVAHPTGYPLFTLIGFIWSKIFPVGSVIFRLNLLAALLVALGNFFFVQTVILLCRNMLQKQAPAKTPDAKKKTGAPSPTAAPANNNFLLLNSMAAISGLGFIAFSRTYWAQSTGVEVYSLHIALLCSLLWASFRAYFSPGTSIKPWLLVALLLALSFSNHLTTLLILPALAILFVAKFRISVQGFKTLAGMIGLFALVLAAVYAYLPLRSGMHPTLNYGNTHIGEFFWRHVTGKQYQVWMFASKKVADQNLKNFTEGYIGEHSLIGLAFLLFGIVYAFMRRWVVGLALLVSFAFTVMYSINYNIHDLQPYFLLAYISGALFMAFSVRWIFEIDVFAQRPVITIVALGLPVYLAYFNYHKVDQSENHLCDDYTRKALASVKENAVIITYQWDVLVSPSYYYQWVEGLRKDVLIIDKELLRRTWYYDQLMRMRPDVMEPVKPEIDAFRESVRGFERGKKHNAREIQQRFEAVITGIIGKNHQRVPVYVAEEIFANNIQRGADVKLPARTMLVPDQYFYQVLPMDTVNYYPMAQPIDISIRFPDILTMDKIYPGMVKQSILGVLSNRVTYEMAFGKREQAMAIFTAMRTIDPMIAAPPGLTR